jgi:hypothetical protein
MSAPRDDDVGEYRRQLMSGLSLALAGANVIMQLSRPPVGHGIVESTVESGSLHAHPIKRTRTTLGYIMTNSTDPSALVPTALSDTTRLIPRCSSGWVPACTEDSKMLPCSSTVIRAPNGSTRCICTVLDLRQRCRCHRRCGPLTAWPSSGIGMTHCNTSQWTTPCGRFSTASRRSTFYLFHCAWSLASHTDSSLRGFFLQNFETSSASSGMIIVNAYSIFFAQRRHEPIHCYRVPRESFRGMPFCGTRVDVFAPAGELSDRSVTSTNSPLLDQRILWTWSR